MALQYMVEFDLPEFTEEFMQLIPAQRERINELLEEGVILSYSLSLDRARLWVLLNAKNKAAVRGVLSSFPLIDFMVPNIYELMFTNSATVMPSFSLN
jgi:hypothetical protein